jgi:hypothetical protein
MRDASVLALVDVRRAERAIDRNFRGELINSKLAQTSAVAPTSGNIIGGANNAPICGTAIPAGVDALFDELEARREHYEGSTPTTRRGALARLRYALPEVDECCTEVVAGAFRALIKELNRTGRRPPVAGGYGAALVGDERGTSALYRVHNKGVVPLSRPQDVIERLECFAEVFALSGAYSAAESVLVASIPLRALALA